MNNVESFDMDKVVQDSLSLNYVLTPVPDSLTVHWIEGSTYCFDEVFDGSSLVWIDVLELTYNSGFSNLDWTVDDPGTLYFDDLDGEFDLAYSSPVDLDRLQNLADQALVNYKNVFDKLVQNGVTVVEEG